jgi:hypothetical protein
MKKFLVAAFFAMLLASLAALVTIPSGGNAAPPAAQYGSNQPTGQYLDLFACSSLRPLGGCVNYPNNQAMYPANTPFHLSGGWQKAKGSLSKTRDVQFQVDSQPLTPADFTYRDGNVGTRWVRNFSNGLSGTHVLTIHYTPCPWTGPGPISETPRWQECTLSMEVTFS